MKLLALRIAAAVVFVGMPTVPGSPALVTAQERSLHAERTVDFVLGKALPLDARVGEVRIQTVEFIDRGRTSAGGLGGLVGSSIPATSTTLRTHVLAENPTVDEWEVTFTVEFLDRAGAVIDRATKKSSWEGEAKPSDLDHPLLRYVVPLIAQVRIKMEARLD